MADQSPHGWDWRAVPEWCHQGESPLGLDVFGLCAWAMGGNRAVLEGRGVMSPGEIENAARVMIGFNPLDPATDKGENLEAMFRYISENGWPGDPTLKIASWRPVDLADIGGVIERRGGSECWLMLPMTEDGAAYDFSDDALFRGANGVYAHAVEVVKFDGRNLTFITWAKPQVVSLSWAQSYFRGQYETVWTDIA